jgi:hypothetical protein
LIGVLRQRRHRHADRLPRLRFAILRPMYMARWDT